MFLKDKIRDLAKGKKPQAKGGKRPSPQQEQKAEGQPRRKRPAPEAQEPRKRPAEPEQRRRHPAQEDGQPGKRPAPQEERPAGRPAPEGEQPRRRRPADQEQRRRRPAHQEEQRRRRPAPQEEQPRRRPAPGQERRPEPTLREEPVQETEVQPQAEARPPKRRPAPEAEPRRRRPAPGEKRPEASQAMAQEGDDVYRMENAPRRNEAAPRPRTRRPAGRPRAAENIPSGKATSYDLKTAPQGTGYKRQGARARKSLLSHIFRSKAGVDPELLADEARMRLFQRDEVDGRKKHANLDIPAVVYTDPKPFNRNRLLVQLMTVLAAACAFVLALSIFFKVKVITISGAETYSTWSVREASGITEGDNLLTFGRARASGQITANLPYVESVRIGIKLPDTVIIEIKELDVAYSVMSGDGDWWLMTSSGKIVEQINEATAKNYTKVLGVAIDNPAEGEDAYAVEAPPSGTNPDGSPETPVTVSGAQRLNAAMQILKALEDNDIVGEAASVNVSDLEKIELWYGQRYQVDLGDASRLEEKVTCMYDVILQLSDYQTGMLDVSFTRKQDQVIYTPFV